MLLSSSNSWQIKTSKNRISNSKWTWRPWKNKRCQCNSSSFSSSSNKRSTLKPTSSGLLLVTKGKCRVLSVLYQWLDRTKRLLKSKDKCCRWISPRLTIDRLINKTIKNKWWPRTWIKCNQLTQTFTRLNSTKSLVNHSNQSNKSRMHSRSMLQFSSDYQTPKLSNKISRSTILNLWLNSKVNKASLSKVILCQDKHHKLNSRHFRRYSNNSINTRSSSKCLCKCNRMALRIPKWRFRRCLSRIIWVKTKCKCLSNKKSREKMTRLWLMLTSSRISKLQVHCLQSYSCKSYRSLNSRDSHSQRLKWTKMTKLIRHRNYKINSNCRIQLRMLNKIKMRVKMPSKWIMHLLCLIMLQISSNQLQRRLLLPLHHPILIGWKHLLNALT